MLSDNGLKGENNAMKTTMLLLPSIARFSRISFSCSCKRLTSNQVLAYSSIFEIQSTFMELGKNLRYLM